MSSARIFKVGTMKLTQHTDYAIRGLSTAIEPVLLVFIGILVLLLALGVFLPLWSLGQAAMGRHLTPEPGPVRVVR